MKSLFKKLFGKPTPAKQVPDWAPFANHTVYEVFMSEVKRYFDVEGLVSQHRDGVMFVQDKEGKQQQLGLVNLAQMCLSTDPTKYRDIIKVHFDIIVRRSDLGATPSGDEQPFETAKEDIGIRIYNADSIKNLPKLPITAKDIAPGLCSLLVMDLPEKIESLSNDAIERWGVPAEELSEIGLQNIRNRYDLTPEQIDLEGIKVWLSSGDHFYSANLVFDLDRYDGLVGPYGALVTCPVRNACFVYPIADMEVLMTIHKLIPIILGMHRDGPGSLSDKLYWYHDDKLIDLPFDLKDNDLTFSPPAEFVQVLQKLAEESSSDNSE